MTRGDRFRAAVAGESLAFAPILWERLPELVRQPQPDWWRAPATGQRLIADAAALAHADAMFAFVAHETVRAAAAAGLSGDDAIDGLAQSADAAQGGELVACVHEVCAHAIIAAVPAPAVLSRELAGEEPEAAEDAFSDLALCYLQAGADAIAVTGDDRDEVSAGVGRAASLGELFSRPVLALCGPGGRAAGWTHGGTPVAVLSESGDWPAVQHGVVTTSGDVSGRWSAEQLRAAGGGRP